MGSEEYPKVADYFVVAGLTDTSQPLDEDLAFSSPSLKLGDHRKDPITDICVIDKTLEESCPQGFTCIDQTPGGMLADLNHGSLTAHNMFVCYRRGKDKPPLIDLGVYYEGLDKVKNGISKIETTPAGRSANINNKNGMGSHPIYLTFRRAMESAPQNLLVVTDICIILTNKGERAPYAFCQIEKNLNKGLIGSNVYLCYKKSMRQVDSISYKAGFIDRYPRQDSGSFSLPVTVPLFCLPMGATVECWSSKTRHPLPTFSSFVLTTETSDKVYGAVISFYENYPEENLTDDMRYKLGLLRGDGLPSQATKTIHTNKAICLLSRWPMFSAFRDFLIYLYKMTVSPKPHDVPVERHIAHFLHKVPFPSSQRPRVQYQMSPFHQTILTRPQVTPIPLSGASFLALLDDMGPENTITLLVLALTEHKIVIHSLRPAEITRVAEAILTLLFPFKWQCTYVPLCPLEMGYVMEAPCPFIVGVDSRYFDLFEPPSDVACVNLDTNSITIMDEKRSASWKMLPKKPAKLLRSTLQRYSKEVKECPREESLGASASVMDPDISRTERHRRLELNIQEAVLKLMAVLMKGYRQYLLPITEAPGEGTTDPSSLFSIQEFVRSREKTSHRFFNQLIGTQLFSSFIEERSLTSFIGGGELAAGRSSSLVFFDECIDRLTPDYENLHLIEGDESSKSEHTVMIMAPDESGLPPGMGYQYTTFPRLQDELFILDGAVDDKGFRQENPPRPRRASDTFTFGRRTKQEVRIMQKMAKMHCKDPQLWARLLLSHTFGAWFACLPAFVLKCRFKEAALRTAHDALYRLEDKKCLPLPDETFYRMLIHLCSTHNKPAVAFRVYQFARRTGTQLSAITYGLYNKTVLEGTWPVTGRDGYALWRKLRNALLAIRKLRQAMLKDEDAKSSRSSESDTTSRVSMEDGGQLPNSPTTPAPQSKEDQLPATPRTSNDQLASVPCDYGYNSMPKDEIRRGSPFQNQASPLANDTAKEKKNAVRARSPSGSTGTTTDSVISSTDVDGTPKSTNLERTHSNRSVQPPSTLDIPLLGEGQSSEGTFLSDRGMKSDDTLVNGDNGVGFMGEEKLAALPSTAPMVSPIQQTPYRGWCGGSGSFDGAFTSSNEDGGGFTCLALTNHTLPGVKLNLKSTQFEAVGLKQLHIECPSANEPARNHIHQPLALKMKKHSIGSNACHVNGDLPNGIAAPVISSPIKLVGPVTLSLGNSPVGNNSAFKVAKDPVFSPAPTTAPIDNNVFVPPTESSSGEIKPADSINQRTRFSPKPPLSTLDSPATPELASLFKDDSKFLSSFSESDQQRYQELCRRPSSFDSDSPEYRTTRHGSLLSSSGHSRFRSSSTLFPGTGRISPHITQKSLGGGNSTSPRGNFDNITADDLMSFKSPTHPRSLSGSIRAKTSRSPAKRVVDSPTRKIQRKMAGGSILIKDGEPMLSSTPLRPVPEPADEELIVVETNEESKVELDDRKKNTPIASGRSSIKLKQEAVRKDISHLAEDPLSPGPAGPLDPLNSVDPLRNMDPLTYQVSLNEKTSSSTNVSTTSSSRHLVDEILEQDGIIRSSSDATLLAGQRDRLGKSTDNIEVDIPENKLRRKSSLPSQSPTSRRKLKASSLQRSVTCHDDITNSKSSSSWYSSGSKFNSLLKATTVGMANKAKKVASNLAKDLNESMQASLAYYTPEKEDLLSRTSSEEGKKRSDVVDYHGSQCSLKSSDAVLNPQDTRNSGLDKVPRRSRGKRNGTQLERPLSVPHMDPSSLRAPTFPHSSSIPGSSNDSGFDPTLTISTTSLTAKMKSSIEVVMSSCARCHNCNCFVYDEEIMAGWIGDDSNLNTHCPHCASLFVPFLNIEITDYRLMDRDPSSQLPPLTVKTPSHPPNPAFDGSVTLVDVSTDPHLDANNPSPSGDRTGPSSEEKDERIGKDPSGTLPESTSQANSPETSETSSMSTKKEQTTDKEAQKLFHGTSDSHAAGPRSLEPITFPYLSSLVLRKELESLLENEGTVVLTQPHFVDHHPIIYWNLVWYFRRLNLHSNLFDLLAESEILLSDSPVTYKAEKPLVSIYMMWDNLKLHDPSIKPPLYCAWLHMISAPTGDDDFDYAASFLDDIVESIKKNDVRGPLVAVLNEMNAQREGARRSAYREILYLVVTAIGSAHIDIDAFDREYKRAYNALTRDEFALTHKCDRPPSLHTTNARSIFGELSLIK